MVECKFTGELVVRDKRNLDISGSGGQDWCVLRRHTTQSGPGLCWICWGARESHPAIGKIRKA